MKRFAVANDKGGVGKTTTAVTLAYLLSDKGPTLLVDGDEKMASATEWVEAGPGTPFTVVPLETFGGMNDVEQYQYVVLDTKAGEESGDLEDLARAVDLLIVPSKPDALSIRGLVRTLIALNDKGVTNYRVLLTDVPPAPSVDGHEARKSLMDAGAPLFASEVRRASAFNKAATAGVCVRDVKGDRYAKLAYMDYELVVREVLR